MAGVFLSGGRILSFPTLGEINNKKFVFRCEHLTLLNGISKGYLFAQCAQSNREMGVFAFNGTWEINHGGGKTNMGDFDSAWGDNDGTTGPADDIIDRTYTFERLADGTCNIYLDDNPTPFRTYTGINGGSRTDGCLFTIFSRLNGDGTDPSSPSLVLPSGSSMGDFTVHLDDALVIDATMPTDPTATIVPNSVGQDGTVSGSDITNNFMDIGEPSSGSIDTDNLPTDGLDELVLIGASITGQVSTPLMQDFALKKHGVNLTVIKEANGGWGTNLTSQNIETIIAPYANKPLTKVVMHLGGNDITAGTQFSDLSEGERVNKFDNLRFIYDTVHAAGLHLFQASLSHRNYSLGSEGTTLDLGSDVNKELRGSYSYTRDWIVPVMREKAPYALYDRNGEDWPYIDAYNDTRNIYNGFESEGGDVIHPGAFGTRVFELSLLEGAIELASGNAPAYAPRRDYTLTTYAQSPIDLLVDFKPVANVENQTNPNINVVTRDGNYLTNLVQTDGSPSSASVYVWGTEDDTDGSSLAPSEEADETNSQIQTDAIAGNTVISIVEGLEPFAQYRVIAIASGTYGDTQNLIIHDADNISDQLPTNPRTVKTKERVVAADGQGRVFVLATKEGSTGSLLSGLRVTSIDEPLSNAAPIANAGPDQSVAAGARVQLNATLSSDPEDGAISQFGWEQVDNGADAVVLEFANTATPEFTAPSSLTEQTLEFRVQAQDSEGATSTDTVTVTVAALEENAILSIMETLDFELVTQGNLIAFKGRSNREVMRLKPSSDVGIVTEDGYLDLSKNGIAKIEIIANGKKISNSNSDSIKIDGNRILARLGDLDLPTGGRDTINPTFMIVLYVGDDTRGLVVASNATAGYKPLSYRVEDAA